MATEIVTPKRAGADANKAALPPGIRFRAISAQKLNNLNPHTRSKLEDWLLQGARILDVDIMSDDAPQEKRWLRVAPSARIYNFAARRVRK